MVGPSEKEIFFPYGLLWFLRVVRGIMVVSFFGWLAGWSFLAISFVVTFVLNGGLMIWGMFVPNSQLFGPVLFRGKGDKKVVALTFDDGPSPDNTARILDVLDHYNVPATFFVVGRKAARHKNLIQRMVSQGHEVENHTWSHSPLLSVFPLYTWKRVQAEVTKCSTLVHEITQRTPRFIRFPAGIKNLVLMEVVYQLKLSVIGFSVRAYESNQRVDKEVIKRRIQKRVHPGAIILLHDGGRHGLMEEPSPTVSALPTIIEWLQSEQYEFVQIHDLE